MGDFRLPNSVAGQVTVDGRAISGRNSSDYYDSFDSHDVLFQPIPRGVDRDALIEAFNQNRFDDGRDRLLVELEDGELGAVFADRLRGVPWRPVGDEVQIGERRGTVLAINRDRENGVGRGAALVLQADVCVLGAAFTAAAAFTPEPTGATKAAALAGGAVTGAACGATVNTWRSMDDDTRPSELLNAMRSPDPEVLNALVRRRR